MKGRCILSRWGPYPIHTIVTHFRPHLDEIACIWVLRLLGRILFPGIENAKVIFYTRAVHEDGRSEVDWLMEGFLFIGVRGGMFDDHPHDKNPNDCAFTLVLKALGVREKFEWCRLAREVFWEDQHAGERPGHWAPSIKRKYNYGDTFEQVYEYMAHELDVFLWDQQQFQAAMKYLKAQFQAGKCFRQVVNKATGKKLWLCVVVSDDATDHNPTMQRAAMITVNRGTDKERPAADLFIQFHKDGHMQVWGNKTHDIRNLRAMAADLRQNEFEARSLPLPKNVADWGCEGMMPGAPWFYHQSEAAAVFNGTQTARDIPAKQQRPKAVIQAAVRFLVNYVFAQAV